MKKGCSGCGGSPVQPDCVQPGLQGWEMFSCIVEFVLRGPSAPQRERTCGGPVLLGGAYELRFPEAAASGQVSESLRSYF